MFYEWLVEYTRGEGFELNLYDPFITNKMIRGKQITVFWHLEDLNLLHVNPKEVTIFID